MIKEKLLEIPFFKKQNLTYAFDSLTKVVNRELICAYIQSLIDEKVPFTAGLIDIDNFKQINDTLGHQVGDKVLEIFADKVLEFLGNDIVVGRYGGDEFIFVAPNLIEYDDVWNVCHDLNNSLKKVDYDEDIHVTMTCGLARYPLDATDYELLLSRADKALYRGKSKGRNCFIIYLAEKHENIQVATGREANISSVEMLSKIYKQILKPNTSLKDNINSLLLYFSNTLSFDHICIETENKMYFKISHGLAYRKDFEHIPYSLIAKSLSSIGLLNVNERKYLSRHNPELYQALKKQEINSLLCCKIEVYGTTYGALRVDMTGISRVWQQSEINLVYTAAQIIALKLSEEHVKIEELFE